MIPRRPGPVLLAIGAAAGASYYLFFPDPSRSAPTSAKAPLSPSHFTPSTVLSNEQCGSDTKLLRLAVSPNLLPPHHLKDASFGPIWSVYIKDDDIQVERPYTPLEGIDDQGRMSFWIKRYPKGEVGRWLHTKSVGDTIDLRGPLTTWLWKDETWDEVVMISGGTGITPFYQLFHSVISRQTESKMRFTLLHSSRTPADLPPPIIMEPLVTYAKEHPETLSLRLFVDSDEGSSAPPYIPTLQVGRIAKGSIEGALGFAKDAGSWWQNLLGKTEIAKPLDRKILFLVCGPEPMISSISGPYGRNFSQGVVGGVLGEMGFTSKQVWKL